MNIESIKSISKASGYRYEVIFSEGDEKIGKSMEIASIREFDPEAFSRMFLQVARQAERDFAFRRSKAPRNGDTVMAKELQEL